MAQTGSAQREPSMEEILASIRRIIEDSDTVRKPLEEPDLPQVSPSTGAEAGHEPEREIAERKFPQHEIEAFAAELREPQPVSAPPAGFAGWAERDLPETGNLDSDADAAAGRPVVHPLRAVEEAISPVRPAIDFSASAEEDDAAPAAFAGEAQAGEGQAGEEQAGEGRTMLMSDRTGRQVAAAFGELSEAFAASRRRSFDEMAEEMLRPMLQDWLDNNLPTLVERLVREEIERVARGG